MNPPQKPVTNNNFKKSFSDFDKYANNSPIKKQPIIFTKKVAIGNFISDVDKYLPTPKRNKEPMPPPINTKRNSFIKTKINKTNL